MRSCPICWSGNTKTENDVLSCNDCGHQVTVDVTPIETCPNCTMPLPYHYPNCSHDKRFVSSVTEDGEFGGYYHA